MLSSLILSLVMSSTPAVTNVNDFNPEVVGTKRGTVRIDSKNITVEEVGTKRGTVRI